MTNYNNFFQGLNLLISQELFFDFEKTLSPISADIGIYFLDKKLKFLDNFSNE